MQDSTRGKGVVGGGAAGLAYLHLVLRALRHQPAELAVPRPLLRVVGLG